MISSIDQPNPNRERECPPEHGWAVLRMEGWVWEMFIEPVSDICLFLRVLSARKEVDILRVGGDLVKYI